MKGFVKRKEQEFKYDLAARRQIKKKAQAAYYREREKSAIKEAKERARKPRGNKKPLVDQIFSGDVGFNYPQDKPKKKSKKSDNMWGW